MGRRVNLVILYALDIIAVYCIKLSTERAYATGHWSIFKGTITLNQTYKIVGISGGPIAGPINAKRTDLLHKHMIAIFVLAGVSSLHTLVELAYYYRGKKVGDTHYDWSWWLSGVVGVAYFIGWTYAVVISGFGFIICALQFLHDKAGVNNSFSGLSVSPQQGAQFAAIACALLLVSGVGRVVATCIRQTGSSKADQDVEEKAVRINM